jgi:chromosome segregation ATPase
MEEKLLKYHQLQKAITNSINEATKGMEKIKKQNLELLKASEDAQAQIAEQRKKVVDVSVVQRRVDMQDERYQIEIRDKMDRVAHLRKQLDSRAPEQARLEFINSKLSNEYRLVMEQLKDREGERKCLRDRMDYLRDTIEQYVGATEQLETKIQNNVLNVRTLKSNQLLNSNTTESLLYKL